jgi:hypothetical protein
MPKLGLAPKIPVIVTAQLIFKTRVALRKIEVDWQIFQKNKKIRHYNMT